MHHPKAGNPAKEYVHDATEAAKCGRGRWMLGNCWAVGLGAGVRTVHNISRKGWGATSEEERKSGSVDGEGEQGRKTGNCRGGKGESGAEAIEAKDV